MFYKMKNLLVFCVTFFSCLVLANLASAQTSNYVKASIGVGDVVGRSHLGQESSAQFISASFDSEVAQPISLTYGYRFTPETALEVEVSSRRLDSDGEFAGKLTSKLLNLGFQLIQEYSLSESFKPYIGAGFGVGQFGIKVSDGVDFSDDDIALTVLANTGLNYYFNSSFSAGVEFKYISNISEPVMTFPMGIGDFRMSFHHLSYGLSAAYHF